jgi:hypothetical protein
LLRVVLEYEHHDQAARFQVGRWKREEACRKLRLVDWFLPSMNRSNPSAGCEHPGVRHPCGIKDITIGNLRSSPRATNADQLSARWKQQADEPNRVHSIRGIRRSSFDYKTFRTLPGNAC